MPFTLGTIHRTEGRMAMGYWRREAVAAATGFAAVVVAAVAVGIGGAYPGPDTTVEETRQFFIREAGTLRAEVFLLGIASVLALWFLGSLRGTLRRAEGAAGRLASVAHSSGVLALGGAGLSLVLVGALSFRVAADADAATVASLYGLAGVTLSLAWFPVVAFVAATMLVGARTGVLPQWLVSLGIVPIALAVLGGTAIFSRTGDLAPTGSTVFFAPVIAIGVWVLAVSAVLTARLASPVETAVARRRIGDPLPATVARDRRKPEESRR